MIDIKKKLFDADNKLTFIIGYRNLFNIAVMFWAFIYFVSSHDGTLAYATGLIIFIMGCKWFLVQSRENIDAIDFYEMDQESEGG